MTHVLLTGTKKYAGQAIHCWAPDGCTIGQRVRWNGAPWTVSAVYGTRLSPGVFAQKRERPRDEEES